VLFDHSPADHPGWRRHAVLPAARSHGVLAPSSGWSRHRRLFGSLELGTPSGPSIVGCALGLFLLAAAVTALLTAHAPKMKAARP